MRWIFTLVLVLLTGCASSSGNLEESEAELTLKSPPRSFALQDDSGNTLGYASALNKTVLVAPDHLWQVGEALYYQDQAIQVLARDFRHDLIFFTVPNLKLSQWPEWSNKPPGVGQVLSWKKPNEVLSAPVLSAKAEFELGNVQIEDVMQLSVQTSAGSSGLPLYDADSNKIYGMLIASDTFNDVSYFVRSDTVLTLAQEYLDL